MNACLIYVGSGCLFDGYLHLAQFTSKNLSSLWSSYFSNAAQTKKNLYYIFHLNLLEYVRLNLLVIARSFNAVKFEEKPSLSTLVCKVTITDTHIRNEYQCYLRFNANYCYNEYEIMTSVMTGLRRVDSLAARCLMSRGRNKRAMVSRQKQEYQRQSRDVNNTRQGSRSQAQVQSSKVGQSGVKHRDSRMNRRTLRNVTRGKQDFALGECLCAAFMWVREWGAGVVRQSELMSEWWQLCDWCNGGRECVSAVHDGKCSPWVMCSLSEWEPDSWQSPPP